MGGTEGAGVVVGWSPRRTRLSFPRKRESRGMNRAPRAGWWGAPWLPSGGGEKTMDSRLQPAGMTEGGPAGGTEGDRREGQRGTGGRDGGDRWEGRKGLGWSWGGPRVAHDCHSRVSGNPKAWAGSQGPAVLGVVVRRMSAFRGRRKDLGFPLTTCGHDRGARREGRQGPDGSDGGGWGGRGPFPASHTTVIPAQAGIQRHGSGAKGWRWWGGGCALCLSSGAEKRPWIPAYNLRE